MGKVVGIDLGTTNSCISVMEGKDTVVIANAEGERITPSVVGFSKSGERLVGRIARRQAITNPDRTVLSIKRHMGTDYRVEIDGKKYTPQEISAMILQKLKPTPKLIWVSPSLRLLSLFQPISLIPSARLPKMLVKLPAWKFSVS